MTSIKMISGGNTLMVSGVSDIDHIRVRIPSCSASSTISDSSASEFSKYHQAAVDVPAEPLEIVVIFPNGVQITKKIEPK